MNEVRGISEDIYEKNEAQSLSETFLSHHHQSRGENCIKGIVHHSLGCPAHRKSYREAVSSRGIHRFYIENWTE